MAQSSAVKVLESIHVSPPPDSVPTTSLRLVYFDMPWFYCGHIERLFFYEFPHPTLHFMETTLPALKRSLSLTLQRFFPYAANIMCPQPPGKPYIQYKEGDFVNFTVAESSADFNHVIANYPRPVKLLRPFVAKLPPALVIDDGIRMLPIIAFQLTVFPNSGICIGSTYCHVVGDGKSFMNFMRSWASVCRSGGDLTCLENSLPLINRDVIKDPRGLELGFLKLYWQWISSSSESSSPNHDVAADKVRATFVLDRAHAERLKHLVTSQCRNGVDSEQLHISTFVVTCAMVWVCLIKSKESAANNLSHGDDDDELNYFILSFDCRNRLEFPVPPAYFGNCLSGCSVEVKKSELVGENGIVLAAKAIGSKIKEVERNILGGSEHGMSSVVEKILSGRATATAGSPKFQVYDTDFGWGRPCKVELTHIDYDGTISLADSRDGQGGIEVYDLGQEAPDKVLRRVYVRLAKLKQEKDEFAAEIHERLRIVVAGGDGTAGWLLGVVCDLKLPHPPPIATVPLGTGNNLPFSFGWGKKNPGTDRNSVLSFFEQVMVAKEMKIDNWHILTRMRTPKEGSCDPIAPLELPHSLHSFGHVSSTDELHMEGYHTFRGGFWNYFSMGMDAQVSYAFHSEKVASRKI